MHPKPTMTTTAVNDTVWEQHRDVIHSLYIEQNLSQQQVLEIISRPPYSLQATSSQFERILSVVLKISKNLTKPDWVAINYHTSKRKHEDDKDTEVFVNGVIQDPKKLRRQARRYANRDLLPQGQVPQIPLNVSLRTPPSNPIQDTPHIVYSNSTPATETPIYGLVGSQYKIEPEFFSDTGIDWSEQEWQPQPDISDVLPFSHLMTSPSRHATSPSRYATSPSRHAASRSPQPTSNDSPENLPVTGTYRYTVLLKKLPWFEFEDSIIPKLTGIFRLSPPSTPISSPASDIAVLQFPSFLKQVICSATDSNMEIRSSISSLSQIIPERSPGDLQKDLEAIKDPDLVNVYATKILFSLLSNNYRRLEERKTAEAIVKWIQDIPLTLLEALIQERGPTARSIISQLLDLIVMCQELPALKRCIEAGLSETYLSGLQGGRMLLHAMSGTLSFLGKPMVLELLRWNPDITIQNEHDGFAIHLATDRQWPEVLDTLLELGANLEVLDSNNKTPLARAIFPAVEDDYIESDCKTVAWLLDHGADIEKVRYSEKERIPPYEVCALLWDRYPHKWEWLISPSLVFAAVSGSEAFAERVRCIEKDGGNTQSILEEALFFTMRTLGRDGESYAFHGYCRDLMYERYGDSFSDEEELIKFVDKWEESATVESDVLDIFLQYGVDPNVSSVRKGSPLLMLAIKSWSPEDVQQLLNHGAKIDKPEVISTLFGDSNPRNLLPILRHILFEKESKFQINRRLDNGRYPLQSACCIHQGRLGHEIVKELVRRGAQINGRPSSRDNYTALHFAVKHGRLETVRYLIEEGAKIRYWLNKPKRTLFELCAQRCSYVCETNHSEEQQQDRLEVFKLLLEKGAERNVASNHLESDFGSCLAVAIDAHGESSIVDKLIHEKIALNRPGSNGGDRPSRTPLQIAVSKGLFKIAKRLIENGADVNLSASVQINLSESVQGQTALQMACQEWGSPAGAELVELLLKHGADVNAGPGQHYKGGKTALQEAICNYRTSHYDLIELLFSYGADINGPSAKEWGRTALQFACLKKKVDFKLINLLMKRGADINAPAAYEKGVTALQAAVIQGNLELVFYLLERGAKVDAPGATVDGRTALEAAAEHGRLDISQALLNAFEALELRPDLEKPLELARKEGHFGVVELLEQQRTR